MPVPSAIHSVLSGERGGRAALGMASKESASAVSLGSRRGRWIRDYVAIELIGSL